MLLRGEFKDLQRLGPVLHVSPSRNIITKTENVPKIGDAVVDENLKPIGKVFDIFGPVSSPYVAVRPSTREAGKLSGKMLYVIPSERRRRR
jgi:RNA-binding protein